MITYKRCTEASINDIYQAFIIGFSDYIIKMEIPFELFVKRFFGPEGNDLMFSFIALDVEKPVGVILGGIKMFEGIKTLRCGTLCVHPNYRGKGISRELFKLHKKTAIDNKCKQLFLEVIVGNNRAINFYKSLGYDIIYYLSYFSHDKPRTISAAESIEPFYFEEINMNLLRDFKSQIEDIHITWQNSFDYMGKIDDLLHYSIKYLSESVGAISIHKSGKIYFIWLNPSFRKQGLGKALIGYAANKLELSKVAINFANNGNLEGFLKHLGFKRDSISQYEMYITL